MRSSRLPLAPSTAARRNPFRPRLSLYASMSSRPISSSGPPLGAWTGRKPDEHVVNRTDEKDIQSQPSHQAMREKAKGDSDSHGVAETGGHHNKKAEQDWPKAPKPIIGMNDERGQKGH